MKNFEKFFPFFLIAGVLVNLNGLLNDILEPDGALYATISKHIALSGDWMNLFADDHDWLDKPHFHFWITALSFKLFGITAFAYKLPAFIFWLAGVWFTYLAGKELYSPYTAKIAVIIYVFSLHGVLNNFDIRAEPYLTAFTIAGIYYFYKAYTSGKWLYIFFTALAIACAIMTKGIFVLITIGSGFIIYWIISGQWKQFVNYRWWLMLVLVFLFITPELYSLYVQFDLHPEKVVFGRPNVSGLRFFFWDSQFGRFFNTGPITGHGDKTFFLHTTLWAFLPWSILLYVAVIKLFNKQENTGGIKWIIYGSAAVTFLLFSFSGFQLPHYIVILFPHFALITAGYISTIKSERTIKNAAILQNTLSIIAVVAVSALAYFSGFANTIAVALISAGIAVAAIVSFRNQGINTVVAAGVAFSVVVFFFLHNFFYPKLLQYQAGMLAGKLVKEKKLAEKPALYKSWSYTYEFYAPGFVETIQTSEELDKFLDVNNMAVIYTQTQIMDELLSQGYNVRLLQKFSFFHISMLTGKFINPATREGELEKMVLIVVEKK